MVNGTIQVKLKTETHKKLKKLINLEEFYYEKDITFSELIDNMMEKEFKLFDNQKVVRVD